MKHFFFPYESKEFKNGILNDLFDNWINNAKSTEDEQLKGIYDAVDTIYDKRLEQQDDELCALLGVEKKTNLIQRRIIIDMHYYLVIKIMMENAFLFV